MFEVELPSDSGKPPRRDVAITQGRLRRTARLAGATAQTAGEAIAARMQGELTAADAAELHARAAERYAQVLGRSKGALMKAGQMLSFLSPAVAPEHGQAYSTALARLYDEAPPMAPELARAVLERELGDTTDRAFAEFDWMPLASASIGQVHAARLHDGRAVAVKIQYPGVAQAVDADLKNVELVATFFSLIFAGISSHRWKFDLRRAARELTVRITEELDYRIETVNQAEFAERYRGHPFIFVPDVVRELSSGRVLTQELATGVRFDEAVDAPQELRDRWAEAIYRFAFGSFHRFGLLHADPHPGNFLFGHDGSVAFLDFGCVKRFPRCQVAQCRAVMLAAFADGDPLATWRAGVEAGLWQSSDPVTPEEAFALWRELRGYLCLEQPLTLTPEVVARCVERCSPGGPFAHVLRNLSSSSEYTLMPRVEMGVMSLLAHLRPTNDWRAISAELFDIGQPLTEMGARHHAFFAGR
jgi:predicted unusual protein kinase regulating ubiquinone biosynthesis (AarF/ABC1/UbiB family)